MLRDLFDTSPADDDALYEALLNRDPAYEARAFVGVTSTGIFCRLTCPARKPKRENCRFFKTVADCMEAGFRPCKRCKPLQPANNTDPMVRELIDWLEADPGRRITEADITNRGLDPSTVRRSFKRHFGMTFLEMARLTRLRQGFVSLSAGARVIDAQLDAGFSSPAGFHAAVARLLGQAPGAFDARAPLKTDWIDTPLGPMIAVADNTHLHLLEFMDRKALPRELQNLRTQIKSDFGFGQTAPINQARQELERYFSGQSAVFETPLALHGGAFTKGVWRALQQIPPGETRSYGTLAAEIGRPSASRAVARANGANQIAILIPCHRVIGADGTLTGYGGGLWRKKALIELEHNFSAASSLAPSA